MVLEQSVVPFSSWLASEALPWALYTVLVLCALAVLGWIISVTRHGPVRATTGGWGTLSSGLAELAAIKPRRVVALARIAYREALHSWILWVVFAIYLLLLAYGSWTLPRSENPVPLFMTFVIDWNAYLALVAVLLLSVFSLPGDIKRRTIFTVMTKPVTAAEIILGRVAGFTLVGATILVTLGTIGYVFVYRMLDHNHQVDAASIVDLPVPPDPDAFDAGTVVEQGRLTTVDGHTHRFTVNAEGVGFSSTEAGHWHVVRKQVDPRLRDAVAEPGDASHVDVYFSEPMEDRAGAPASYHVSGSLAIESATMDPDCRRVRLVLDGNATPGETTVELTEPLKTRLGGALGGEPSIVVGRRPKPRDAARYTVGSAEGLFQAKVVDYGHLSFRGRAGEKLHRGVSVGNEWAYRSFIDGGSLMAAVWQFSNVAEERFGDQLPLELTVRVFRTSKGEITKGLQGSIVLRNPETGLESHPRLFLARDNQIDAQYFSRFQRVTDKDGRVRTVDLYEELVSPAGKLEVVVQSLERAQLFGVARPDAYLRARQASFTLNYVKGHVGTLVQVLLVATFGVMFSTYLSGPIALLAMLTSLIYGFFAAFTHSIVAKEVYGGGPFEQMYRLLNHMNQVSDLPDGFVQNALQALDTPARWFIHCFAIVIPDFSTFSHSNYLAAGFDIPYDLVAVAIVKAVAYCAPTFLLGFFVFKTREIAL